VNDPGQFEGPAVPSVPEYTVPGKGVSTQTPTTRAAATGEGVRSRAGSCLARGRPERRRQADLL